MSCPVYIVSRLVDVGHPLAVCEEVFASKEAAFAYVIRQTASLIRAYETTDPSGATRTKNACGRLHRWIGNRVEFHVRMGKNVVGYRVDTFEVRQSVPERCGFCGYYGELVEGRDEGLMACANCGAQ